MVKEMESIFVDIYRESIQRRDQHNHLLRVAFDFKFLQGKCVAYHIELDNTHASVHMRYTEVSKPLYFLYTALTLL